MVSGYSVVGTHAAIASYDPSGKLTLWACKQAPFAMRRTLAVALAMDESKIRFVTPHIGGGFGGKAELLRLDICAALLSMKTGRPVKIAYDREKSMTCTRTRYAMASSIKTGVRKDGAIIAQHCRIFADGGGVQQHRAPGIDPGGTFGSGVTLRAGDAVRAAAASAKRKLFAAVAPKLGVKAEELQARDHRIFLRGNPEKGLTFREALKIHQYNDEPMPIVGRGYYLPPVKEPTTLLKESGDMSPAYSFGTQDE